MHLLRKFESTFRGVKYLHRNSKLGDSVALKLFDDLYALDRCQKFTQHVDSGRSAVCAGSNRVGKSTRRGDGTFGQTVPGATTRLEADSPVPRGETATIDIASEVKIISKAMIKQIDRVVGDLLKQAEAFNAGGDEPIKIAIVAINWAEVCCGYEGDRSTITDGRKNRHPVQEAEETERRVVTAVKPAYDELLILRYKATNIAPFDFEWLDAARTRTDYAAMLARVCQRYDRRN